MKTLNSSIEFSNILNKYKVKCKCGHVVTLIYSPSKICEWCGRKVYRSKKDEFEDKLKKELKK